MAIYLHVVSDSYRSNVLINRTPERGRVILDLDDFEVNYTPDLEDRLPSSSDVRSRSSRSLGKYEMLKIFSWCVGPGKKYVKNIFLTNIEDADLDAFFNVLSPKLSSLENDVHLICYDETTVPFDFRLLCVVRKYPPSTFEERFEIFSRMFPKPIAEKYARVTEGLNLSEVHTIAGLCQRGLSVERATAELKIEKLKECGMELVQKVPDITKINTVPENVKNKLLEIIDGHERASVLLVGPSGSGKTYIGTSLLNAYNPPSILLNSAKLIASITKPTFRRRHKILDVVESVNPTGLLIDQFDFLSGKGMQYAELMDTILKWLEYRRFGILVSTTTSPEEIDMQLMRPGRFDAVVLIPFLDYKCRYNLLLSQGVESRLAKKLARRMKYCLPADLVTFAKIKKFNRPSREYIFKTIKRYNELYAFVKSLPHGVVFGEPVDMEEIEYE